MHPAFNGINSYTLSREGLGNDIILVLFVRIMYFILGGK
jgi:hypothetical protein